MLRSRATTAGSSPSTPDGRQNVISRNRKRLKRKRQNAAPFSNRVVPTPLTLLVVTVLLGVTVVEVAYLSTLDASSDNQLWKKSQSLYTFLRFQSHHEQQQQQQYSAAAAAYSTTIGNIPMDDYSRRPHIRQAPVPLIVGGSDGSGTRAFVQALQDLGVDMIVEDQGTMDVHGLQILGGEGWPGLVSRVFKVTHSADYSLDDLPESLKTFAFADLGNMLSNMRVAAEAMRQAKRDIAADANKADTTTTAFSNIEFGFKAPVSMLLLPFFRHELPAFKFLHIVRDGRDVAFSDNHSPVEKFYDTFYPDAKNRDRDMLEQDFGFHTRNTIKAMQLWNDWNKQVYDYEMAAADGQTLDVLVMRSEDLLNHKYEALLTLADFVGSTMSPQQICCLSKQATKDIGKVVKGNEPHALGANDFEPLRGRFNGMVSDSFGEGGVSGNIPRKWAADTGSWADIRQKMLAQHRSDNVADNERRRLLETAVRLGENLRNSRADMTDAISRFSNRLSKAGASKPDQVKDRYGKWRQKLIDHPELKERLFEDGRTSLQTFGYEPQRIFMDSPNNANFHICEESVICAQN
jgi:hypothetical protein